MNYLNEPRGQRAQRRISEALNISAQLKEFKYKKNESNLIPLKEPEKPAPYYPKTVRYSELRDMEITEVPRLIGKFMDTVGLGMVFGDSDAAKSSFMLHMAIAVASGDETFLPFQVNATHKKVIFVPTEDNRISIASRATRNGRNYSSPQLFNLEILEDWDDLLTALRAMLNVERADLIIIDTFGDVYEGNENSYTETRRWLDQYQNLAEEFQCMIIFTHHSKKGAELLIPHKNNILGSKGIESKIRLAIELRTDPINTSAKHMCIVKGNNVAADLKQKSFELLFNESTLTFTYEGRRVPFENLIKNENPAPVEFDPRKSTFIQMVQMQKDGEKKPLIMQTLGISNDVEWKKLRKLGLDNKWSDISD